MHLLLLNTSTMEKLVLRSFSFRLKLSTTLCVFSCSEWASCLDRKLSYYFKELIITQQKDGAHTLFYAGEANNFVRKCFENSELTMFCKSALIFSCNARKCFAEFKKSFQDEEWPLIEMKWKHLTIKLLILVPFQRFYVFELKWSCSCVSTLGCFVIIFKIADTISAYFTFGLGNKASLPFRFFSISWSVSFLSNIQRLCFSA